MAGAARAAALAGALCLLAACQDEPDFEERYEAAQTKIRAKAAELDSAIAKADRDRAVAQAGAGAPEEPAKPE